MRPSTRAKSVAPRRPRTALGDGRSHDTRGSQLPRSHHEALQAGTDRHHHRQHQHSDWRSRCRVARQASARALRFHPDPRQLAQPGGDLVRHPYPLRFFGTARSPTCASLPPRSTNSANTGAMFSAAPSNGPTPVAFFKPERQMRYNFWDAALGPLPRECQNCMKNFQDSTPIQFTSEPGSLLVLE